MRTGKKKSKEAILATTVRRGIWRSKPAYRDVSVELRFPPFDILVMNTYHGLVATEDGIFWRMKATSNGSFFLFPMKNQKVVEVVSPNGRCACVSVEASGIVATLITLKRLSPRLSAAKAFSRLIDYSRQQPDSSLIDSLVAGL